MTESGPCMKQWAPYPQDLDDLVAGCTYRRGWAVYLEDNQRDPGCGGLTLIIVTQAPDSYDQDRIVRVRHLFPVPPATYNRASWCRWLFERFHQVELHEAMEYFRIDGYPVFAPNHGPGWDPYLVTQLTTDLDRATRFDGTVSLERPAPIAETSEAARHEPCAACGRPRSPDHDADAPGPTVRHPFASRHHPGARAVVADQAAHYDAHPPVLRERMRDQ